MAYSFYERILMIKMQMLFIYGSLIKYLGDVVLFGTCTYWVFSMKSFTTETKFKTYLHWWFGILLERTQILPGNTFLKLMSIL